jgi:rubrerythrin
MQTKTIYVNVEKAGKIYRMLHTQPLDEEHCMGEDETYSETAVFDDGYEVDVKLCGVRYEEGGDNTPWTEAVLFKDGCEVTCTDVSDEFFGEWRLETDDETYVVFVERCEPDNPEIPLMQPEEAIGVINDVAARIADSAAHAANVDDSSEDSSVHKDIAVAVVAEDVERYGEALRAAVVALKKRVADVIAPYRGKSRDVIHDVWCPSCGNLVTDINGEYCPKCGQKIENE